jgi:murein DD-endopeptidase MepM/ murein hydrolase activator NlpD
MGSRAVPAALFAVAALIAAADAAATTARSSDVSGPTVEGGHYKGSMLQCVVPDGDKAATFAWLRDDVTVDGATDAAILVTGADVGHRLACRVTFTRNGAPTAETSAPVEIVVLTTAIVDRSAAVQRGPTLTFLGQIAADGPTPVGAVLLVSVGKLRNVVVARTQPDAAGAYLLERTVRALVPGRLSFRIEFVPDDPELDTPAEQPVTPRALSPLVYPFARSAAERAVEFSDGIVPFWSDGTLCAVGCRPPGAINGWPLKPFHEQHGLRSALNERRLSGSHVGIDIMTTRKQPVYAIQSGYARILHAGDSEARVRVGNYIYWHVNLRVREGQYVRAYHTVLGHTFLWMRHLHLSEVADADSSYLNPLRPGGRVLTPWTDIEPPVIGRPAIARDGTVTVSAFDPQSFTPKISYEAPVLAPAALAYRMFEANGAAITKLEWALRGSHWLPNALASTVFTPDAHSPGYFCFALKVVCKPVWRYRLAGGLAPRLPLYTLHGRTRLTVYAWDWAGNVRARDTWLSAQAVTHRRVVATPRFVRARAPG